MKKKKNGKQRLWLTATGILIAIILPFGSESLQLFDGYGFMTYWWSFICIDINIFWYNLLAENDISRMQILINSRARIPSVENAGPATGLVVFAKVNLTCTKTKSSSSALKLQLRGLCCSRVEWFCLNIQGQVRIVNTKYGSLTLLQVY